MQKLRSRSKGIKDLIVFILVVVVLIILCNIFVGQQIYVLGDSMEETLYDNDSIIVEKVSYYTKEPARFDVIVFKPKTRDITDYYVKRIIGLPGETIRIEDGQIYINGKLLEEHFGKETMTDPGRCVEEILLGEDEYFVLGDNRNVSKDSRFVEIGNVKRSAMIGKVWARIWPFHRAGIFEHEKENKKTGESK